MSFKKYKSINRLIQAELASFTPTEESPAKVFVVPSRRTLYIYSDLGTPLTVDDVLDSDWILVSSGWGYYYPEEIPRDDRGIFYYELKEKLENG